MQIGAGGCAFGIVVHMPFAHRFIFLVVENDDNDRQLMALRRAERLDDGIVKERAVADQKHDWLPPSGELDAECRADPLAEPARAAEEALRHRMRQVLANER